MVVFAAGGGVVYFGSVKIVVSPSKVTIEHQSKEDATSTDLPEYACSPSPIRWSFLADSGSKTPSEFDVNAAAAAHDSRERLATPSSKKKKSRAKRNKDTHDQIETV